MLSKIVNYTSVTSSIHFFQQLLCLIRCLFLTDVYVHDIYDKVNKHILNRKSFTWSCSVVSYTDMFGSSI